MPSKVILKTQLFPLSYKIGGFFFFKLSNHWKDVTLESFLTTFLTYRQAASRFQMLCLDGTQLFIKKKNAKYKFRYKSDYYLE